VIGSNKRRTEGRERREIESNPRSKSGSGYYYGFSSAKGREKRERMMKAGNW
jgi:hypothetical protein